MLRSPIRFFAQVLWDVGIAYFELFKNTFKEQAEFVYSVEFDKSITLFDLKLLSGCITLSPGTISVVEEPNRLRIHALSYCSEGLHATLNAYSYQIWQNNPEIVLVK